MQIEKAQKVNDIIATLPNIESSPESAAADRDDSERAYNLKPLKSIRKNLKRKILKQKSSYLSDGSESVSDDDNSRLVVD